MNKIIQLSPHIANLIAAGEVVERPASVVKELVENAVDAGANKVTVEIKDGGMTFLRVTDNGCGMSREDARTAFLRHATSKLHTAEDLAAIGTMGFRGEALAAIASVSRIDLMTKTADTLSGTSLRLEAGAITEESEVGCPDGTTIIVRDLFFNTPARMKFMRADAVEGGRVNAAMQMQALAHPNVAMTLVRDGKQLFSTPGGGDLRVAMYCIYGREVAQMSAVDSTWDEYRLRGYVSKPTDARQSRAMQTFFVNGRPVKSKIMVAALEEAYRNQILSGRFPACVLHLSLPANVVDVNVHPAKTEVKFLREKDVFDCIHYGVLGALNKTPDRPQVQLGAKTPAAQEKVASAPQKQPDFFRTMDAAQYNNFVSVMENAPQPKREAAVATYEAVQRGTMPLRQNVVLPQINPTPKPTVDTPVPKAQPVVDTPAPEEALEQIVLPMSEAPTWRLVGELYRSYILVEQGEDAFLIDKHAAHERILFDKLKAHQEKISSQVLLTPASVRLSPAAAAELLANRALLSELGFEIDEFGDDTVLLRQIPMDLHPDDAADAVESIAADLLNGRRERADTVRDELLHTVACKAAIKAGWVNDEKELWAVAKAVMENEELKYCPHGRPICISLSKKLLEKQFKRS